MGEVIPIANQANLPKPPQHVRITLMHWLWWLTITAVLLALHRDILQARAQYSPSEPLSRLWFIVGVAKLIAFPFQALATCCLGRWFWSRFSTVTGFPNEPGHWLLLCIGIYTVSDEIAQLAVNRLTEHPIIASYERIAYCYQIKAFFVHSLVLLVAAEAIWSLHHIKEWAAVFVMVATAQATLVLSSYRRVMSDPMWYDPGLESIAILCLIGSGLIAMGATATDLQRRDSRDLLHWLGLISTGALLLPTIVLWWAS